MAIKFLSAIDHGAYQLPTADGSNGQVLTTDGNGNVTFQSVAASSNYYLSGASFNTGNGILTLTVNGATNQTVDLDGRYALSSHSHNYDNYGSWNLKTNGTQRTTVQSGGDLNLVAGSNVSLSYSAGGTVTIASTDTNTDTNDIDYINGASFNTGNGILSLTGVGNAGASVDLDGRYLPLSGGNMSGLITFQTTSTSNGFYWNVNSDQAGINFKNTGDGDSNSFLNFFTKDNGNEYFKFSHRHYQTGGKDYMDVKDGIVRFNGDIRVNASQNGNWDDGTNYLSGGNLVWHDGDFSATNILNWNTAYGWGNHASAGYLTSETYTAHEDTSTLSGAYGGNNNGIVIEDITVDSNGHVTAVGTRDLDGRFDSLGSAATAEANAIAHADDRIDNEVLPSIPTNNNQLTNGAGYITAVPSSFSTNSIAIGSTVTLTESTDRADLLYINSSTSSWGGLQIGNTSNEFIFSLMGDGTTGGIYDDQNSDWLIQWTENAGVRLYHNAGQKLTTTSTGITITGEIVTTGGNSTNWNTAYSWGDHAAAGYVTSSGNTVIGTDSDIITSGATVVDDIYMTDGVITSHSTRTLTLANLGYTGSATADDYGGWRISDGSVTEVIASGDTLIVTGAGATGVSYDAGTNTLEIASSDTNTNNYITGASFSTSNGVLTLTRQGLGNLTVDLDGRFTDNGYADALNQHLRTSDSPSFAGMTINGNLTVTGTTVTDQVEVVSTSNGILFEGSAADAYEGLLKAGTLTADRTYTLPNASGTVALTSNIPTVNNATLTVQGTGALGGSGTFTANASSNVTISISHDDTSTLSGAYGGSNNGIVIEDITVDGYGHVTAIGTRDLDGRFATPADVQEVNDRIDIEVIPAIPTNNNQLTNGAGYITNSVTDFYVADQILHTGDTDTYMQFHAANQWRVVTGGGERLEVNNTNTTVANILTASGGINGLTLNNGGISGSNFNITGVNQLEIADPGEGIVFTSGASGNMTLAIVDDASDNILNFSGTGATLQVNGATVATQSWVAGQGFITSAITSVSTSAGLDGAATSGAVTISLDLSELTDMTAAVDTAVDELILLDNGAERRKRFAEIFGSAAYQNTSAFDAAGSAAQALADAIQHSDQGDSDVASLIPTNNNQLTNGAGYVTSSGNTVIGTDSDINTSGFTVVDQLNMTDGVIQSHTTRSISNLYVEDTRAAERVPNDYLDKSLSLEFTDEFGSLGAWYSGITLKGWSDNYTAWQLISSSNTSTNNELYFRTGTGTSWNSMYKVWHNGNLDAFIGASVSNDTITFTKANGGTVAVSTSDANTNYYVNGLSFDTGTGVLTASVSGTTNRTVDLDGRYQLAGTYNTIIGTDSDINTSGSTIIDNIYVTDGVITSMGTRTLTLGNLGYTGDTAADNYYGWTLEANGQSQAIRSQATGDILRVVGSGATSVTFDPVSLTLEINSTDTNTDTNTTYTADGNYGMTLSGTAFRLENDRRRNSSTQDIYTGNTHDYTFYDASVGIRWYTAGAEDMRLLDNGTLHVDGDVIAYSTTISDQSFKDDVVTIDNAIDKVKKLRGVEYTWNSGSRKGKRDLGLIAQEVEEVLPEIVHEHEMPLMEDAEAGKTYKTVDYEKMVGVLIEAMKEQQSQIDSLKAEVELLKGK